MPTMTKLRPSDAEITSQMDELIRVIEKAIDTQASRRVVRRARELCDIIKAADASHSPELHGREVRHTDVPNSVRCAGLDLRDELSDAGTQEDDSERIARFLSRDDVRAVVRALEPVV
jgi:hypothetical protein